MNERELLAVVSSNVRRYRLCGRWSQAVLAEKTGISTNFLSDIETGKKWPSILTMIKFAEVFSIEVYELLKPEGLLPDNSSHVISRYTQEVLAVITKSVENVETKYISQMKRPS